MYKRQVLKETGFSPAIRQDVLILMTLLETTCSVERSFSTLRRVKTWLRSTISDNRLSSLCLISVHWDYISQNKTEFIDEVIEKLSSDR